jgi:hypothetical protein
VNTFQKIAFWLTVPPIIVLFCASFIVPLATPLEFAGTSASLLFYNVLLVGFPLLVLFTTCWTIKKSQPVSVNVAIALFTIVGAIIAALWAFAIGFEYCCGPLMT